MLHRAGWSVRRVEHFIKTVARIAGDEEMKKRSEVARATKKNLRKGKAVTGRPALRKILGKSVVNLLTDWLELRKEAEKSIAGPPSRKRAFQIEALRLVELSHPPRRLVEVQAGRAEEMQTLYLSPGTVMEPKKLATAIANQTGEILHKEDSRLGRLAKAVRRIPRGRGVSNLGWTPSLDTFMYGQHALRTAGHPEKLVFLTGETQ
jgi:hypothetical protein